MKKFIFIIFLIIVCLCVLSFLPNNKENNDLRKINVGEVTHSPFYAPFYVAINNGYFKEEGLDISVTLISGANNVVAAVLSGDIEIGFCGPEASIYVFNGGEKDYIRSFAGLTKRDGQFIVARKNIDNFTWDMLKGKEILVGRVGGMPALNFENALKNTKINKNEVNINTSVDYASLSSAFIAGQGDYVNLFEPNATKLVNMNLGYIVASVGEKSGEMPYTAFNAKKSFIENNKELITKFNNAINKGLKFVKENEPNTIANVIINTFPDTSVQDLTTIIKNYKQADSWLDNTYISEEMFKNLENVIIDSGELDTYVPYEKLIYQN